MPAANGLGHGLITKLRVGTFHHKSLKGFKVEDALRTRSASIAVAALLPPPIYPRSSVGTFQLFFSYAREVFKQQVPLYANAGFRAHRPILCQYAKEIPMVLFIPAGNGLGTIGTSYLFLAEPVAFI